MTEASQVEAQKLRLVMGELIAAERLLTDPEVDPAVAGVHVHRAWAGLYGVDHEEASGQALAWVRTTVAEKAEPTKTAAMTEAALWLWRGEGPPPTRACLLEHAALIRSLAETPPAVDRWTLRATVVAVLGLCVAMAGSAIYSVVVGPRGPWRGEYFSTPDFQGPSVRRDARKIAFDWLEKAPFPGAAEDQFSAVFETCLTLTEDTDVRFRLSSDDGSRLLVNGTLLVDNWGAHATLTRNGRLKLPAGKHYLRIEYFEAILRANLLLEVALGFNEEFSVLPPTMLSQPSKNRNKPCG